MKDHSNRSKAFSRSILKTMFALVPNCLCIFNISSWIMIALSQVCLPLIKVAWWGLINLFRKSFIDNNISIPSNNITTQSEINSSQTLAMSDTPIPFNNLINQLVDNPSMHADVHSSNQTNSFRQMSQTLKHVPNQTQAIKSIKPNTLIPSNAMQIKEIITATSASNTLYQPHHSPKYVENHLRSPKEEVQINSNSKESSYSKQWKIFLPSLFKSQTCQ